MAQRSLSVVKKAILLLSPMLALAPVVVRAEPVADRLLSNVRVSEQNGCAIVRIEFNLRVQYQSHFPLAVGDELRIQVHPLDQLADDKKAVVNAESLRAPSNERASIHGIELETLGPTSKLTVYFRRNVAFKVAQGVDFKSILIAISGPKATAGCEPVQGAATAETANDATTSGRIAQGVTNKEKSSKWQTDLRADDQQVQALLEAQSALEKSNPDRAVQLLTKLLESGGTKVRQDAQELLGDARFARGQLAHARAEYQDYLRQYPSGPGADRVRQRLAAMESAPAPGVPVPPADTGEPGKQIKLGPADDAGGRPAIARGTMESAAGGHLVDAPKSPTEWTVTQFASVSTYYNMNQGGRGFIETPRVNVGWDKEDPYRSYQSAFLSNFDYDGRFENAAYAGRLKFSASQQNDLVSSQNNQTRITSLYLDGRLKDAGITTRVGRQSATGGGVLGRFDGVIMGYQATETVKLTALGGSPVERSQDLPFHNHRYFYGAGTEASFFGKQLETSAYLIEQRTESLLDRQAVGTEMRYVKDGTAGFGNFEYDTHFSQINSAVLTSSRSFGDQSNASINLDYRRSPILLASNALQGQGVYTLSELLQRYTRSEVDQLALDRTAKSYTGTASYSRPINPKLQWSSDVTVNYLSGMPGSGGIDPTPSTGMLYFLSTQLTATGVFREGDSATAGVRYANSMTSDRYMLDFGTSYPISPDWRVNPMLRFGYAQYKTETRQEYQVIPSVRTSYQVRPDTAIEFEVGGKGTLTNSPIEHSSQYELLFLAGVRYDWSSTK
jgi:Tetratricopeptide repeat